MTTSTDHHAPATPVDVTLPRVTDAMETGAVGSWHVADGATVAAGDPIADVETDKATVEIEAPVAGVVELVAALGVPLAVGAVVARIMPAAVPAAAAAAAPPPAPPTVRRAAMRLGVDLAGVSGTGPRGRITVEDVERAAAPDESAKGSVEATAPTLKQDVIARRMSEAKATIPEFVLNAHADMDGLLALRETLRDGDVAVVPTLNDFVVKAVALALRDHPGANGAYVDGGFERYSRVNVGVAVAAPGALLVPVICDADTLPLGEIARRSAALAGRAREGRSTPADLEGATFTVSNLGMFGITSFVPIINPPQAAILGVGSVEPAPVVVDGAVAIRSRVALTLVCDHRILHGADGAGLLQSIRARLEQPGALLL